YRSKGWMRALWISLAVWALLNLWICGRRKMISMLPVFWGGFLILHFKFKSVRLAVPVAGVILLMAGLGWFVITQTYHTTGLNTFYMTTFSQLDDSVAQHGFRSVVTTLEQAGFWGYGLGMGQQGIHHIPAETPRLWQESGPSKLAAELGAPGMFLLLCLFAVLLRTAWAVVSFCRNHSSFSTVAGLFSILIANMASAVVSGQIFGDPFIILFLAFMVGLLWAHPAMIMQQEDSCAS
ncbi:MAG TPA: hypothetical protein VJ904_10785, partial [Tichowtungia sp.]|nr:hypothetical protein [Tichowtungia sp.]